MKSNIIKESVRYYRENNFLLTFGRGAKYLGDKAYNTSIWLNSNLLNTNGLSLKHRLRAIYYGVDFERYVWLGLNEKNPDNYFTYTNPSSSEFRDKVNTHREILRNKLVFNIITEKYTDKISHIYGIIYDGVVYEKYDKSEQCNIIDLLDRNKHIFLKPTVGSQGKDLYSVKRENGEIYINGDEITDNGLIEFTQGLNGYIIEEFVNQHEYAKRIYPHTTNTLRVIVGYDTSVNESFIFSATHRFGSAKSKPADNRSQGGYAAPVNLDSGRLGSLVRANDDGERRTYTHHPETNVRVQGEKLPFWNEVCELVKYLSDVHHQLPLVGWDVVITPTGPVVIEGNSRPKSILGQLEKGYLEDERIERILKRGADNPK